MQRHQIKEIGMHGNISMTASTAMARLQFVNGQTIHSWSGYGDGYTDLNTLIERIQSHGSYKM